MRPARQVGGDFYDAFHLDSSRLALLIGDVCGKGMPAALFMSRALTLLRGEAMHPAPAAQRQHMKDFMTRANRQLCRGNAAGYFASVFAAVLDVPTGVLTWVNAGHPPPALARGSSEFRFLDAPRNVLLGVDENAEYEVGETALPPGSALFLYTDGVTEAENAQGVLFGEERLLDLLNDAPERDAPAVTRTTMAAVDGYAEGAAQSDDITLLALRYEGPA
jgi:serine phosphatase RsbU (regulator of sigma subunit)